MPTRAHHRDCRNFAPVDVTKGICHLTKDVVPGDAEACDGFQAMPKCGNCAEFDAAGTPGLGTCRASAQDPKCFAYPDMVALTCGHYRAQ